MANPEAVKRLIREMKTEGLHIDAGFLEMRLATSLLDAPPNQVEQLRMAFFGGAQHELSCLMTAYIDDGREGEVLLMAAVRKELKAFGDKIIVDLLTEGNA